MFETLFKYRRVLARHLEGPLQPKAPATKSPSKLKVVHATAKPTEV